MSFMTLPMLGDRKLDLNLLLTLEALFRTGGVTAASEILGVTQPAVSHGLKLLRRYFDDPLFVRVGNRLVPTPRAIELQEPIARLGRDLQTALAPKEFDPATAQRVFSVCLSDLGELLFLKDFLEAFRRAAPACSVRCLQVSVDEIAEVLQLGNADLAFGGMIPEMPATLRQRRMFDFDYVCIMAASHPSARAPLDRSTYCDLPHAILSRSGDFEDHIEQHLARAGIRRKKVLSLSHHMVAAKLIAGSDLVATVPRIVAPRFAEIFPIAIRELPFKMPRVVSRMYWHEQFNMDTSNKWLRALAYQHLLPT